MAGGALVFFGLLAGLFGSNAGLTERTASDTTVAGFGGDEPPPTTSTTLPPTLREMAPVLSRPLHILYLDHGRATISLATWELDAATPGAVLTSGAAARRAEYDASRQQTLWITEGNNEALWIGKPPIAEPVFVDVLGAAWHPTAPRTVAWVGIPPGAATPHLYRASSMSTRGVEDLIDMGPVPERSELVGWGDWGFVLRVGVPVAMRHWEVAGGERQMLEFTLVLDLLGRQVAAIAGTPHAVGPNGEILVGPASAAHEAATAAGFDVGQVGIEAPVVPLETELPTDAFILVGPELTPTGVGFPSVAPAMTFVFHPDGTHVVAMGEVDGRYAITTEATDGSSRRITSVDDVDVTLGFVEDGSLLILHNRLRGDLVFHDWDRGASYRVPFAGGRILAVDG